MNFIYNYETSDSSEMSWDFSNNQENFEYSSQPKRQKLQQINVNIMYNTNSSHISKLEKRNQRERNRVEKVNREFNCLRQLLADSSSYKQFCIKNQLKTNNNEKENKTKNNLSKVKLLRTAIDYIRHLKDLLDLEHNPNMNDLMDDISQFELENIESFYNFF